MKTGTPASQSAWSEQADKTLGTALSSLGTAEVVLENQADGRLTRPYVVVTMRDLLATLDKESAGFIAGQPPVAEQAANRRTVEVLQDALVVLTAASTAASSADEQSRREALDEVRRTYDEVKELQDELTRRAP